MYRVLSRRALAVVLVPLALVSLAINRIIAVALLGAEAWWHWIPSIFTTPSTCLLIIFVPQFCWQWAWARWPKLNTWIFPNLNGTWETETRTNFDVIARHHPDFRDVDPDTFKNPIHGKFKIVQDLFHISIRFDSSDGYSTSKTMIVEPQKNLQTGEFSLTYVYRNDTQNPKKSDEQFHFGAAYLEISHDFKTMSGRYWTNRNASKGHNTAGTIKAWAIEPLEDTRSS